MKRILLPLLIAPLILAGCAELPKSLLNGNTAIKTKNTAQTSQLTAAAPAQKQENSMYQFLSQYLSKFSNASLYGCRSIGHSDYLLCFADENNSQYQIEHTSLLHGKESCMFSGGIPVYTSEGFWVLSPAATGTPDVMELDGTRYDRLATYRNTLQMQAYVDVSVFGKVDAFAVDMKAQTVYAVSHNTQALRILRMGFFQNEPTVVTSVPLNTEGEVQEITQIHAYGNQLIFCGKMNAGGQTVSCFGQVQIRQGTMTLHHREDGGNYAMKPYDCGTFVYDADYATGTLYRIEGGKAKELALEQSQESTQIYTSPSGEEFATSTLWHSGSGERLQIRVYSSNGDKLASHEYALGDSEPVKNLYFDENARRVIFESADSSGKNTWKEITY